MCIRRKGRLRYASTVTARPLLLYNSRFLHNEQCVYCTMTGRGGQEPGTRAGPTVTECQSQGEANSGPIGGGAGVQGRECPQQYPCTRGTAKTATAKAGEGGATVEQTSKQKNNAERKAYTLGVIS